MEKILQKRKSLGNLSTADHMGRVNENSRTSSFPISCGRQGLSSAPVIRGIAFCNATESAACKQKGQACVPRPGVVWCCYDPVHPQLLETWQREAWWHVAVVGRDVEQRKPAHRESGNRKRHIPAPGASSHLSILNYVPGSAPDNSSCCDHLPKLKQSVRTSLLFCSVLLWPANSSCARVPWEGQYGNLSECCGNCIMLLYG
nr:uncharacterized protein LOC102084005 isoform X1 [Columba livia]XP_021135870.1 uncharacterized protein LOC102084005 isoform X1 [Columba livia]